MDYLVELARHPDILEAIKLDSSEPAKYLRRISFLATDYPNAWVVEVVHQFYACPKLASQAWENLRYCATSRRRLAECEEANSRLRMFLGHAAIAGVITENVEFALSVKTTW